MSDNPDGGYALSPRGVHVMLAARGLAMHLLGKGDKEIAKALGLTRREVRELALDPVVRNDVAFGEALVAVLQGCYPEAYAVLLEKQAIALAQYEARVSRAAGIPLQ